MFFQLVSTSKCIEIMFQKMVTHRAKIGSFLTLCIRRVTVPTISVASLSLQTCLGGGHAKTIHHLDDVGNLTWLERMKL